MARDSHPREPAQPSAVLLAYFWRSGRWIVYHLLASYVALARLASRGLCSVCGYNLTGNMSGICSECGTPIPSRTEAVA